MTFQCVALKSAAGIHMNRGMVGCHVYARFIYYSLSLTRCLQDLAS